MRKHRIAGWANRRRGGRRKPIPELVPHVITGRGPDAILQWSVLKRYRTVVLRVPGEYRRRGERRTERCPIPITGPTLAETTRPKREFYDATGPISKGGVVGLRAYVETHLPRPQFRRR